MSGGPGADRAEPAARREPAEEEVGRVTWVSHNPAVPPSDPVYTERSEAPAPGP